MVAEFVARWSGARVGTGATVWHFEDPIGEGEATAAVGAIQDWYSARAAALPNDVTVSFDREVKVLSLAGDLTRIETVPAETAVVGTYSGNWANGSGRLVRTRTDAIAGNRRLQGRIFLVPSGGVTDNDGNVLAATIAADQTAHNALLTALTAAGCPLQVWSRVHAVAANVTSMSTQLRPVGLRSRNDR